ncbi:MAG TPA: GNAT family N-acetyltransferase [Caulobacteraceae bacterium]|nr:GNAT family N-acetyltransferase [Caulobacteraceae bacterium]
MKLALCADPALLAMLHAAAADEAWNAAEMAELLASPGVSALVATADDGAPAAFILCRLVAGEAEVLTLASRPDHRRQGLASTLLVAAEILLREQGARRLFLEVAEDNTAARALYARAGFHGVGRRTAYYVRGRERVDALVLRRDLHGAAAEPYA